jgi:hypothetical protein
LQQRKKASVHLVQKCQLEFTRHHLEIQTEFKLYSSGPWVLFSLDPGLGF